jgi:hypothetical protein
MTDIAEYRIALQERRTREATFLKTGACCAVVGTLGYITAI